MRSIAIASEPCTIRVAADGRIASKNIGHIGPPRNAEWRERGTSDPLVISESITESRFINDREQFEALGAAARMM